MSYFFNQYFTAYVTRNFYNSKTIGASNKSRYNEFLILHPKKHIKTTLDIIYRTSTSIILLYEFNINIITSICYTRQPNPYIFRGIYQVLLCEKNYYASPVIRWSI